MRCRALVGSFLLVGCVAWVHTGAAARIVKGPALQEAQPAIAPALAEAIRTAEQRFSQAPDNPALMFDLGSLRARAGDRAGALALLEQAIASKTGMDPAGSAFDRFKDDPAYQALVARIRRDFPPVSASTLAFTIPEPDLIPEGMAYDPASGRFFVGSIQKQKIVAIARGGAVTDFVASARDGLMFPLGLRVDAARGLLWAACTFQVASPDEGSAQRSGVAAYELASGRLARRVLLDAPDHQPNDLVVTKTGDVYVTDTRSNEVYRLAAGGTRLERVLDGTQIQRPNGIALSPDESRVFIAAWPSIVAMDLRTNKVTALRHPTRIVTGGIDGLYFHNGSLVGVQNDVHPGRVVRYELSPDLQTVERVQVLESYNPRFEIPTTGAIADGSFYYMANTQLAKAGTPGKLLVPVSELKPIAILRTVLRW